MDCGRADRGVRAARAEEMEREIARDEEALGKRFYDSTRHTIQLDHYRYLRTMRSEMAKGRRRAAAAA